jgi:hypothetical protein
MIGHSDRASRGNPRHSAEPRAIVEVHLGGRDLRSIATRVELGRGKQSLVSRGAAMARLLVGFAGGSHEARVRRGNSYETLSWHRRGIGCL